MPSPTTAAIPPRPSPHLKGSEAAAPLGAAAAFAAAEIAGGLILGAFFAVDRAEAHNILQFRPLLLLFGAVLAAGWSWRRRILFYAAAIGLAAAAETILLLALGADRPWAEAARGLAGGAGAAVIADLLVQAGRRWRKGLGAALGALVFFIVYTTIGVRAYEAVVIDDPAPRAAAVRPPLLLMTSLPIVWGEGGAFDPASRPAAAYRLLEREFEVRPIDAIQPETLRGQRLMLLAQPRLLAPEEMVVLDQWVRGGGRILILADERLAWPSDLPPGDARRPPAASLLHPLFRHWGLRLDPGTGGVRTVHQGERRLRLDGLGQFASNGAECRIAVSWFARCRIGAGEAIVIADADLLHDRLWAPADGRHRRLADNGLLVAEWLDSLAGLDRPRTDREIAWIDPGAERGLGLILAALPIVLTLLAALALGRLGRA
jgi:hypothetical protein